jgi:zinc-binding alcohol dehydrogenase/oxidoreductase
MKAAVLRGVGEALTLEDVPDLTAGPGEAIVQVAAASLNRRDLWIRKGQYAGLKFPIVLGSDAVGVVTQVGEAVSEHWLNRPVIVNPSLFWGTSESHQDLKTYQILGLPRDGTFAEDVKVPAENLYDRPPELTDEEVAAIPLAGLTAYRAVVHRGALKAGENVLVTGVGSGAATFAVQIAALLGANVYVTSSQAAKIEKARGLGAIAGENYRKDGWADRLKAQSGGFDLIIDSAGGEGFNKLIDLANPGGRIVFFGATAGAPPNFESRKVFWKQLSILGTTMGSPADFASMLQFFEERRVRPLIDQVFSLAEANAAVDSLEDPSRIGKVVIKI